MRNVTRRRRALKWFAALAVMYLVLCTVIGIYLAEVAVKPFRREMPSNSLAVARAAETDGRGDHGSVDRGH